MTERLVLGITHLRLMLRPVNRALRDAVDRQTVASAGLDRPELAHLAVTDREAAVLLDAVDAITGPEQPAPPVALTDAEIDVLTDLRRRAGERPLPLDELETRFDLDDVELLAIVLCAAPEVDRRYERLFAYLHDDLGSRLPSVGLLLTVGCGSTADRLARRHDCGPRGRLHRLGLVEPHGDAATGLRQQVRLAPGVFEFLLGHPADLSTLTHDPTGVETTGVVPDQSGRADDLGAALRDGTVTVVGVWGGDNAERAGAVAAVVDAAGLAVRGLDAADLATDVPSSRRRLVDALGDAASVGAALWVDVEAISGDDMARVASTAERLLGSSDVPLVLSARHPWRPAALLAQRPFAQIELGHPGFDDRKAIWAAALPDLDEDAITEFASVYRVAPEEADAVASLARTQSRLNGSEPLAAYVPEAVASITRQRTNRFAIAVEPNRRATDLVLPPDVHRRVMEIPSFVKHWPRIAADWGMARLHPSVGVSALFHGESGTGKTLGAEVVASVLGLPLLKIDLARVVSKWVGETEQNLDAAFEEAERSRAVLFFDEADALFGRRGEVRHGTDRYANVEVGFLLQRLERFDGLTLLASNLKENIDAAFTRRFHFIVRFPKPGLDERRRLWELALHGDLPRASDVDVATLARPEMTGASIVAAARTAAVVAAEADRPVDMATLVYAIGRQFQHEARILRPDDLGRYAELVRPGP